MSRKAIVESVKSFLRAVYFSVLGMVGTYLADLATNEDLLNTVWRIGDVYLQVGVVVVFVIAGVAKLVDRYVRYSENNTLNGIAPGFLQR